MNGDGWVDLCCYWPRIIAIGAERDVQKASFATRSTAGEHSTNTLGIAGEFVVHWLTGLPIDEELRLEGDAGFDFTRKGVTLDVKATTHSPAHLMDYTDEQKRDRKQYKPRADYIVLVRIDPENQCGKVLGHCTRAELEGAPPKDFGHRRDDRDDGRRLAIHERDLHEGLPPELMP